ncbi:heterokaryon incompatibility protein-domain-containing protein [Astrocystis sublimbata]|nr:heterokaryon incompatibility protein-domain-containing protein [Astrocystis sublimbata]
MRLINTTSFEIHEFTGDSDKPYAILSHTWGHDECSFQDMTEPEIYEKRHGFRKIKFCCDQAAKDGLEWAWADSCCIDKSSTAELSEAINSMFRWYQKAVVCYVYLSDVASIQDLPLSRWFTRGWTLQELIAPSRMQFFSSDWSLLGTKDSLHEAIHSVTGVDKVVLSSGTFTQICVAGRMAWAAKRQTTRVEDQAYCLMGIFGVNMPLIYGEGSEAFSRLQQEILRVSDDQSLFAWGVPATFQDVRQLAALGPKDPAMHGLFAKSPKDFMTTHEVLQVRNTEARPPPVMYGNGLLVQYPVYTRMIYDFIMIACAVGDRKEAYLAIPVRKWSKNHYARGSSLVLVFAEDWPKFAVRSLVVKAADQAIDTLRWPIGFRLFRPPRSSPPKQKDWYELIDIVCASHTMFDPIKRSLTFAEQDRDRVHGALFFHASGYASAEKRGRGVDDFAIVLGWWRLPWAVFVPLLSEEHKSANYETLRNPPRYMSKSQVSNIVLINDTSGLVPNPIHVASTGIWEPLAILHGPISRMKRFKGYLNSGKTETQRFQLQLRVRFPIAQANLVDDGTFVSIDIQEVQLKPERLLPGSQDYVEFGHEEPRDLYVPIWYEMDQLEWFPERIFYALSDSSALGGGLTTRRTPGERRFY